MRAMLVGLVTCPLLVVLLAGCLGSAASVPAASVTPLPTLATLAPTPTPDIPSLTPEQVLSLVADRIASHDRRQQIQKDGEVAYQGHGSWVVVWGKAEWEVIGTQALPRDEYTRSLED